MASSILFLSQKFQDCCLLESKEVARGCVGSGDGWVRGTESKIKLPLFASVFCAEVIHLGISLSDGKDSKLTSSSG